MRTSRFIAGAGVTFITLVVLSGCASSAHKVASSFSFGQPIVLQLLYGFLQGLVWLLALIAYAVGNRGPIFDGSQGGFYIVAWVAGFILSFGFMAWIIRKISGSIKKARAR